MELKELKKALGSIKAHELSRLGLGSRRQAMPADTDTVLRPCTLHPCGPYWWGIDSDDPTYALQGPGFTKHGFYQPDGSWWILIRNQDTQHWEVHSGPFPFRHQALASIGRVIAH